jgi:hypothetical protein
LRVSKKRKRAEISKEEDTFGAIADSSIANTNTKKRKLNAELLQISNTQPSTTMNEAVPESIKTELETRPVQRANNPPSKR